MGDMVLVTRRALLGALAANALAAGKPPVFRTDVFRAGEGGYDSFRIPALLRTRRGTLLAFAEARRHSKADAGDIDIALKTSTDKGRTWSPLRIICDRGPDTADNPCPVQDRRTSRILLPMNLCPGSLTEAQVLAGKGKRTVALMWSDDDGQTWSGPRDISAETDKADWTWYAVGPGNSIQLRSGRLVVPCNHARTGAKDYYSHVLLSDDGGKTWTIGGSAAAGTNECQVAELPDRSLLLNMRSYHGKSRRAIARSSDGGVTWSAVDWDPALVEPVCQASLIADGGTLYFSNPASTRRERLTVRQASAAGTGAIRNWTKGLVLHGGPAAYSSLAATGGRELGCLYECGDKDPYERIEFARFSRSLIQS